MDPPRRRSSRARGSKATPGKHSQNVNHMASLTEGDETPTVGTYPSLDVASSSPINPRTPATAGRIKPALAEMHPSMAHQSTARQPDSGLRLGFADIQESENGQPVRAIERSPSKIGISESSFDFRYARPTPQLGPEAQRMMDELREEALRIKAKLAAEREMEKRREEESGAGISGRKIAQPKGKVGRFSDIHMAEFKKMDSIANHPSSFRAQSGRAKPVDDLKRSPSKARLDEVENGPGKRSRHTQSSERLENDAPAKRARKHVTDDISTVRSGSREEQVMPTPPIKSCSLEHLTSITTPTQASQSRAASSKNVTQIPTLSRTPSKPNLRTPTYIAKSATTPSSLSKIPRSLSKKSLHSPSKLDRVRSLLRYPSASKAPDENRTKLQALSNPNLDKPLPLAPTTPGDQTDSKSSKYMGLTPDTKGRNAADISKNSPSPSKSSIPRSKSIIDRVSKRNDKMWTTTDVQGLEREHTSIKSPSTSDTQPQVIYPSLTTVCPSPQTVHQTFMQPPPPPPSVPGTFTFRHDHTIKFSNPPPSFGSSPGQSSLRQVRQSIFPPVAIPDSGSDVNKENAERLQSVPHGMTNKKRRRASSDEDREEQNDRSLKKQKGVAAEGHALVAPKFSAENVTSRKIASPSKKRGVLSLSRLNMLARPKNRK